MDLLSHIGRVLNVGNQEMVKNMVIFHSTFYGRKLVKCFGLSLCTCVLTNMLVMLQLLPHLCSYL